MPTNPSYTRPFSHPEARVLHPVHPTKAAIAAVGRAQAHADHHAAWLDLRNDGMGGGDASTLMGFNTRSSLPWMYAEKTGRVPNTDSDVMRIGRDMEPVVRERFREATGLRTRRVGMLARRDAAWMRATPDDLTSDGGGAEYKTTTERHNGHEWDDYPSDHSWAQAQWYMLVTGLTHWYIAVLFRDTGKFVYYRVERDETAHEVLIDRSAVFWYSHVLDLVAPPMDHTEATTEAVRHLDEGEPEGEIDCGDAAAVATRRLARIDERIAELKKLRDETVAEARRMIGRHEVLKAHGIAVATLKRQGSLATRKYTTERPEYAARYTTTKTVLDARRALSEDPKAREYVPLVFKTVVDYGGEISPPVMGSEAAGVA